MSAGNLTTKAMDWYCGERRVPILVTCPSSGAPRPAVMLLHGLGADKEVQQKEASSLAGAGLYTVTVDAPHHGARRSPLLDEIHATTGRAAHAIFLRMVREAIAEVPLLVDRLLAEGHEPLGIVGISMGAYVALGAAALEPRITAVVSILGSPDWSPVDGDCADEVRPWLDEAPVHFPERFPPRAMLVACAGRDVHVPPDTARRFAAALRPRYAASPDQLCYLEYPASDHFMREDDWSDLWSRVVNWCRAYLDPTSPPP